jgi:tripartite-type tricarboxylate transporter receptor subunit TctC
MKKTGLAALAIAAFAAFALPAQAQYAGDRPVRVIVPANAGSGQDAATRILTDVLGKVMGRSFVIENRAGANGLIGTDAVAKAPADGYTLGATGSSALAAVQTLYKSVPYDPAKDFAPVYLLAGAPSVAFVGADSPDKTLQDLVARARAAGAKKLIYGTADATGIVAGQMLQKVAGVQMENVQYKSGMDGMADVMRGDIALFFSSVPAARALVEQNKVRPLAVAAAKRIAALPNTQTYAEAGLPGIELFNWMGIVAPAGTPKAMVNQLAEGIRQAIKDPELQKRYGAFGLDLFTDSGPDQFDAYIKTEITKWNQNLRAAGFKPE